MPPYCVAKGCNRERSCSIRFYRFPKEKNLLWMWCQNLRISKHNLGTNSMVCSVHFDPSCSGAKKLKKGAVPTKNLGHEGDVFLPRMQSYAKIRKCCVEGCENNSQKRRMHTFPKEEEKRALWQQICNLPKEALNKGLFVCDDHFEGDVVGLKKLKKDALPTLNLGGEAEFNCIINNDENSVSEMPAEIKQDSYNEGIIDSGSESTDEDTNINSDNTESSETASSYLITDRENTQDNYLRNIDLVIEEGNCLNCITHCKIVKFYNEQYIQLKRAFEDEMSKLNTTVKSLEDRMEVLKAKAL